ILRVEQGTYHAAALPSTLLVRAKSVDVEHAGDARIVKASGTVELATGPKSLEGVDVELPAKALATATSTKTSSGTYVLNVNFAAAPTEFSAPRQAASTLATTADWLPLGGVVAAFFVLGLATYGWRHNHLPRSASLPASARSANPIAPPHHTAIDHVENTYRADPGNIQAALELGLTYGRAGRHEEALPLLLLAVQSFPKVEAVRYQAALALLAVGRAQDAVNHLEYAFRLNPLNVARFLKEGPVVEHGEKPPVSALLRRWSRNFNETSNRGYA
ncbi:MAG: CDC27 family protein, partial [Euryarchaeota archaeon]|nr:CDC27 family protein [Euryarchaeota archaeon]